MLFACVLRVSRVFTNSRVGCFSKFHGGGSRAAVSIGGTKQ